MLKTKRTTKRTTKAATYRVLRGFDYPASQTIRDRIAAGERIPRGELVRHEVGDKIANPPSSTLKNLLMRGWVELIKQKEVSSDTPK